MGCSSSNANSAVERPAKASAGLEGGPADAPWTDVKAHQGATFHSAYALGDQLGSGGFSVVKMACRKYDKKSFAAKIIDRTQATKQDEEGLRQEIMILKNLKHDNIVQFIDFYEESEKFYVVLELLEGGELFDRITQKLFYNEKDARDLVFILLSAVKYCHDQNVVHRDLKPENLLMASKSDDANIKLADFGFAKVCQGFSLLTQCGSPGYVAPEILCGEPYGKPVDMWAIGVITYILLGGYPPFHDDKNQNKLFRKIKKGEYKFHADYWNHISQEAKDLIAGLLWLNPHERLTVDAALAHSWVTRSAKELETRNLDSNLKEFKKFHATRKFRAAAKAIIAVNKMSHLMGKKPQFGGDDDVDDEEPRMPEKTA